MLHLDDLISSLIDYEDKMYDDMDEGLKKKLIALKSTRYDADEDENEDDESNEDEEVAQMTRKFLKLLKNPKGAKQRSSKIQKKRNQLICYECKRPGHAKPERPLLKYKKGKKKAIVAPWDDEEESSSEDNFINEVANICFMAFIDDEVSDS
ncbi:Zf-CCHC domain-containing protein/UBN2 domain-containing protein [Melia azedarach]|uniref:Zf-CCHC domain-containing protein/UBN2 domain-containing protein n=1 Tax=Melia azedarach TaxID=155640 RepID=A0ACC1Y5J5_MELAZ|nr:Zf-CCHC domain-containing protein/UBN2 domain-containing protein [Melia azedarach]